MKSNIKFQTSSSCYEHIGGNNFKLKTMEKKQTAVDILIKAILESDVELYILMQENGDFDQAKQTEKEQIEDAHEIGYINGGNHKNVNGEQYYNETYGGHNE
jgi:hypothetical protein